MGYFRYNRLWTGTVCLEIAHKQDLQKKRVITEVKLIVKINISQAEYNPILRLINSRRGCQVLAKKEFRDLKSQFVFLDSLLILM